MEKEYVSHPFEEEACNGLPSKYAGSFEGRNYHFTLWYFFYVSIKYRPQDRYIRPNVRTTE